MSGQFGKFYTSDYLWLPGEELTWIMWISDAGLALNGISLLVFPIDSLVLSGCLIWREKTLQATMLNLH